MIADYLAANHYEYKTQISKILPVMAATHTTTDYRIKGSRAPLAYLAKQYLEVGFLSQRATTVTYPKVSGTFVHVKKYPPHTYAGTAWTKRQWVLQPVSGTNKLQGRCTKQDGPVESSPDVRAASGVIQPDGNVALGCALFSWNNIPAHYYEKGGNGYLLFDSIANEINPNEQEEETFVGPATGEKVTVTYYDYAFTAKFKALLKHGPNGEYLVTGNYHVEKVMNLRLNSDIMANADFTFSVTMNSIGRMIFPRRPSFEATKTAIFGKKPDGTWAIDSVTLANGAFPL